MTGVVGLLLLEKLAVLWPVVVEPTLITPEAAPGTVPARSARGRSKVLAVRLAKRKERIMGMENSRKEKEIERKDYLAISELGCAEVATPADGQHPYRAISGLVEDVTGLQRNR